MHSDCKLDPLKCLHLSVGVFYRKSIVRPYFVCMYVAANSARKFTDTVQEWSGRLQSPTCGSRWIINYKQVSKMFNKSSKMDCNLLSGGGGGCAKVGMQYALPQYGHFTKLFTKSSAHISAFS